MYLQQFATRKLDQYNMNQKIQQENKQKRPLC